jgi:hypothetical protein
MDNDGDTTEPIPVDGDMDLDDFAQMTLRFTGPQ